MKTQIFRPHPVLAEHIRGYLVVASDESHKTRVLPHLGLVLAIRFKGRIRGVRDGVAMDVPKLALAGLRTRYFDLEYESNTGAILVFFSASGASSFFSFPLSEIYGRSIHLDCLCSNRESLDLEQRLSEAPDNRARILLIENFLIARLTNRQDPVVRLSLELILGDRGRTSVETLAKSVGLSTDAFEKRFRRIIGASPKSFSQIVRMKSMIARHKRGYSLTELAHDHGFYDQAHMIHQFKACTGESPTRFFGAPYPWSNADFLQSLPPRSTQEFEVT